MSRTGIGISAIGCLLAISSGVWSADEEPPKQDDLQLLQGNWSLVSIEVDGVKRGPNDDEQRKLLEVQDHKMQFGEVAFEFRLDGTTSPKLFDVILSPRSPEEKQFEGIYRLEGKTFVLCLYLDDGNKQRPIDFSTKDGSRRILVEFARRE